MDNKNYTSRVHRLSGLFAKKHNQSDRLSDLIQLSDGEDEEDDTFSVVSMDTDQCITTDELRLFVGSWNVAGRSPVGDLTVDLDEWFNLKEAADIYVLGFQELVPLKARNIIGTEDPTEATNWNDLIGKTLNNKYGCPWMTPMQNSIISENYNYVRVPGSERRTGVQGIDTPVTDQPDVRHEDPNQDNGYKLVASKKMVGIFISVWIRKSLLKKCYVSSVKLCSVACGIMGYLGNKGSVSVSMSIEGTSFCFIVAHLASGEKKGDEGRRNHQVSEIFRRTIFTRLPQDGCNAHPLTILGHDRIFWFGDLNYRLYLKDDLARMLIKKQDWTALQEFDQLRGELEDGGVFQGWREGNIEFAPTYKYSSANCNRYSGGLPNRAGEKQRTPAWCDRILWYGKGVKQLSYFRSESKFSDHRPVSALFSTHIEVVKSANPRISPLPPVKLSTNTSKHIVWGRADLEVSSTLRSLIVNEIEGPPSNEQSFRSNR